MIGDWQARVTDEWSSMADMVRVVLYRRLPGFTEVVIGATESGDAIVRRVLENESIAPAGLVLPRGAVEALAETIKPGPSQGELKRLEDALALEQRRVDDVLTRASIAPR